jgi:hypothetical protein
LAQFNEQLACFSAHLGNTPVKLYVPYNEANVSDNANTLPEVVAFNKVSSKMAAEPGAVVTESKTTVDATRTLPVMSTTIGKQSVRRTPVRGTRGE